MTEEVILSSATTLKLETKQERGGENLQSTWLEFPKLKSLERRVEQSQESDKNTRFLKLIQECQAFLATIQKDSTSKLAEQADNRLTRCLEAIEQRSNYVDFLLMRKDELQILCRTISISQYACELIVRIPSAMEALLNRDYFASNLQQSGIKSYIHEYFTSMEKQSIEETLKNIYWLQKGCLFSLISLDLEARLSLPQVSNALTFMAEAFIEIAYRLALKRVLEQYRLSDLWQAYDSLVVIGYGKLGGWELGYTSDLDLVFFYQDQEQDADLVIHPKIILTKVIHTFLDYLQWRDIGGKLYEVDTRLRPNGEKAEILASLKSYKLYMHNEAQAWELQSLVRARVVAGNKKVGEIYNQLRADILLDKPYKHLKETILKMRETIKIGHRPPKVSEFAYEVKYADGGLVDVEFLLQFVVLEYARRAPELLDFQDNVRIFETASKHGLLPQDYQDLIEQYFCLRQAQHRYSLGLDGSFDEVSQDIIHTCKKRIREMWCGFFVNGEW